jgi:adenylate kinase
MDNARQRCLVLFGAPGSGKGTQAKILKAKLGWAHISTGDMLRDHVARKTELGVQIEELMKSGSLVPDEMVNRLVDERMLAHDCRAGFILDGYPRTVPQARLLVTLFRDRQVEPYVVHLKVDYNIIVTRLASRRLCPQCGSLYSVASNAPIITEVCDYDGAKLITRDDDRPEVIWNRLKAYDAQTYPVLEHFASVGYPIHDLDGSSGSPQIIAGRIANLVEHDA